jgi:hypothetical protein
MSLLFIGQIYYEHRGGLHISCRLWVRFHRRSMATTAPSVMKNRLQPISGLTIGPPEGRSSR